MRHVAFTLLLAIVMMAGSAPTWAHGTTSTSSQEVQNVSVALAPKTTKLLAALPILRAPIRTHNTETILTCVNHTLAANGLTQGTARRILPGTDIRVETGVVPSSATEYRLARGDTVWGSCVKELKAAPAIAARIAQTNRAKAMAAIWKSIARPPPRNAVTEVATALAAETATTHLLTGKVAQLGTALAAETAKAHLLTKRVAQLQNALTEETESAQVLERQVALLKQDHRPIGPTALPKKSSENQGDMLVRLVIYSLLAVIVLLMVVFLIGVITRCVKRAFGRKSPLVTGVTPTTESRVPDPATPVQESYPGKGSTIYYQIHPAWISRKMDSGAVYVPATVTEEVVRSDRGAPIVILKGHAPWNYRQDDPREDESVELAFFNPRTRKVTYVTEYVAGQLSRALDHQYDRSPTTLRVHAWLRKEGGMLRVPRSRWARLWTSVIRGKARFDFAQSQTSSASH